MRLCLDTGDFDRSLIPPIRVEPSVEKCVHTPCPDNYHPHYEWVEQAMKTHSQIQCPHCGLWTIWLPKAEAREINREAMKGARRLARRYLKYAEQERKKNLPREMRELDEALRQSAGE